MSTTNEDNKQVAIQYVNEIWGKGDVDLVSYSLARSSLFFIARRQLTLIALP